MTYRKLSTGHTMRDYQLRAAHKLFTGEPIRDRKTGEPLQTRERVGTAVHIDMGLGKTIIGLTAIAEWYAWGIIRPVSMTPKGPVGGVLVIAPIKVCQTVWAQEAADWSHTRHLTFSKVLGNEKQRAFALAKPAHVYLVNPENVGWLTKYLRNDWSRFDAVLIDESSMFKDNRAKRFRFLTNYGTQAALRDGNGNTIPDPENPKTYLKVPPHRFLRSGILTGTPSPQGHMNLWSPFYIIDHGERLHRKFETFRGRFFHKAQQVAEHVHKYDINADEDEARPEYVARQGAPERIHELIADITVELNAEDYGVLPKVIGDASKQKTVPIPPTHLHYVDLPAALRPQYDTLEKSAILELATNTVMAQNGGAKSMMCWQMANGAIYHTDDFGRQQWTELHGAKLDQTVELIDMLNANVIIPYYFKHDLERLKTRLAKEGMAYAVLTSKQVERTVDRWNGGYTPILLLHPQSAGHGLNLQFGGHHFIWFTMLWSLERYQQTLARLARSGQNAVVGNHHILARATTDELMFLNLGHNGDDQTRFRAALRDYQQLRNLGLYAPVSNPLEGLGL